MERQTTPFLDLNSNPIKPGNYLSIKGHIYQIYCKASGEFRFIYSGNFDQGYRDLDQEISSILCPLVGGLEPKLMNLFEELKQQAESRKKPIYQCVSPSDGTWKNRHKNTKVTPAIPDYTHSLPSCTDLRPVLTAKLKTTFDTNNPSSQNALSLAEMGRRCRAMLEQESGGIY